ncbi:uncharacterized protein LOC119666440 [Teleopsis dalmanni]|uniref:uncharacterized protein LOC119666427 n=1 Tax=Teleopsis dalmanni TaxID=139649 RepID=UPI0018CF4068|nr:uncharacterized protein LOC119666427 [Teleopsis dalmanni]XP_037931646.1 uncharacterized protein LOC119666440 [Teleopsis dalmanni]
MSRIGNQRTISRYRLGIFGLFIKFIEFLLNILSNIITELEETEQETLDNNITIQDTPKENTTTETDLTEEIDTPNETPTTSSRCQTRSADKNEISIISKIPTSTLRNKTKIPTLKKILPLTRPIIKIYNTKADPRTSSREHNAADPSTYNSEAALHFNTPPISRATKLRPDTPRYALDKPKAKMQQIFLKSSCETTETPINMTRAKTDSKAGVTSTFNRNLPMKDSKTKVLKSILKTPYKKTSATSKFTAGTKPKTTRRVHFADSVIYKSKSAQSLCTPTISRTSLYRRNTPRHPVNKAKVKTTVNKFLSTNTEKPIDLTTTKNVSEKQQETETIDIPIIDNVSSKQEPKTEAVSDNVEKLQTPSEKYNQSLTITARFSATRLGANGVTSPSLHQKRANASSPLSNYLVQGKRIQDSSCIRKVRRALHY